LFFFLLKLYLFLELKRGGKLTVKKE
jgi:hypothetical protein